MLYLQPNGVYFIRSIKINDVYQNTITKVWDGRTNAWSAPTNIEFHSLNNDNSNFYFELGAYNSGIIIYPIFGYNKITVLTTVPTE